VSWSGHARTAEQVPRIEALVADTGSAAPILLKPELMTILSHERGKDRTSNLGKMIGGWLRIYCPELGLVEFTRGFGSEKAFELVQSCDPNFVGLVGLPTLRMTEYGGNADEFWIRLPS